MFVPRPEMRTPTRTLSAMVGGGPVPPRRPGAARTRDGAALRRTLAPADREDGLAGAGKRVRNCLRMLRRHDHRHADAAIERSRHFFRLDIALRLKESHQPRLRPGVGVDISVKPFGEYPGYILQEAAAGDVRQR